MAVPIFTKSQEKKGVGISFDIYPWHKRVQEIYAFVEVLALFKFDSLKILSVSVLISTGCV